MSRLGATLMLLFMLTAVGFSSFFAGRVVEAGQHHETEERATKQIEMYDLLRQSLARENEHLRQNRLLLERLQREYIPLEPPPVER